MAIVDDFPFIAMDTEFPGTLVPLPRNSSNRERFYKGLKDIVDQLKLIQLGLAFGDKDGNLPTCGTENFVVWQFNFSFNEDSDLKVKESIDLLKESGLDFDRMKNNGISYVDFAERLIHSGILSNERYRWITFEGKFDFAYLLKVITATSLPNRFTDFMQLLKMRFPIVYDVKYLVKISKKVDWSLEKLAVDMKLQRFGICHQSGSDSLLTNDMFKIVKQDLFRGVIDDEHVGIVYRLGP